MLDISKFPMEVAPTAHYSMGGILASRKFIDFRRRSLCCRGGRRELHGANRLGGNSLAETIIFGKRAGIASAKYSKKLGRQLRSNKTIALALKY